MKNRTGGNKCKNDWRADRSEQKSGYSKTSPVAGMLPACGQGCSSPLSAYWPPPHLNIDSALRAPIKYSFSKTCTYITNTSVSARWPGWQEQRFAPNAEQTIIHTASKGVTTAGPHTAHYILTRTQTGLSIQFSGGGNWWRDVTDLI